MQLSGSTRAASVMTAALLASAAMVGAALPAAAGRPAASTDASPSGRATTQPIQQAGPAAAVTAVVVKSWDVCGQNGAFWPLLNAGWSAYGSIPITIDYTDNALCGSSFTYGDLEANGADVVILDDPAGKGYQYTPAEISAIQKYASEGHELIATYLTFGFNFAGTQIDNSALAPLFGLVKDDGWGGGQVNMTPTYTIKKKGESKNLFRGVANPFVSTGFNRSQLPGDGVWSKNDLAGAAIRGINGDKSAAITIYKSGTWNAIYVATMPEFNGGTQDQQYFYNAIIYPSKG